MFLSKTKSNIDSRTDNERRPVHKTSGIPILKPFQFVYILIAGLFVNLNPFNWFKDFSDIEITIEEEFLKKS